MFVSSLTENRTVQHSIPLARSCYSGKMLTLHFYQLTKPSSLHGICSPNPLIHNYSPDWTQSRLLLVNLTIVCIT